MNSIKKEKDELRAKYLAARREMDESVRRGRDAAVCKSAVGLMSFRYAEYVLLYAAKDCEICVDEIAKEAWARGKKVAFPRCDKATHTMKYHIVSSLDELSVDSYGIEEPSPDAPVYDPAHDVGSAVCFVPGLLYDKSGFRLGYGKGFYDRYLSGLQGNIIGVVYSDFIVPTVPIGKYDVSLNILLTEKGVVVTGEN